MRTAKNIPMKVFLEMLKDQDVINALEQELLCALDKYEEQSYNVTTLNMPVQAGGWESF